MLWQVCLRLPMMLSLLLECPSRRPVLGMGTESPRPLAASSSWAGTSSDVSMTRVSGAGAEFLLATGGLLLAELLHAAAVVVEFFCPFFFFCNMLTVYFC